MKFWCQMVSSFEVGIAKSLKGWLRGVDLNHRPLGYEPNELPDCSTPRFDDNNRGGERQTRERNRLVISRDEYRVQHHKKTVRGENT